MRHAEREAVARCPSCGGFFCRECVVEHDGQLICSTCLALKAEKAKANSVPRFAARLRENVALIGALLLLWFAFYELGVVLLRIPPELHDGTLWKRFGHETEEGGADATKR